MPKENGRGSRHEPSEADVIFNRASLALAKSQKLIASWLPPRSELEQSSAAKNSEAFDKEDAEIFSSAPESYSTPPKPLLSSLLMYFRLGLGAQISDEKNSHSFPQTHQMSSSDQRLRQNILGKRASFVQNRGGVTPKSKLSAAVQPKRKRDVQEESEGEEEGRTGSIGKDFATKDDGIAMKATHQREARNGDTAAVSTIRKKAPGSYLDQVLSERSSKRKKKKRNKNQNTGAS